MPLADPTYIGQVASVTGAIVRVRLREDMPSTLVASSHRHELVRGVGLPLIGLPPYSPELNPAERVFEEVRRWIKGKVYPSLEDKVAAVEAYLTELESNPDRVRGLAGWIGGQETHVPATEWFEKAKDFRERYGKESGSDNPLAPLLRAWRHGTTEPERRTGKILSNSLRFAQPMQGSLSFRSDEIPLLGQQQPQPQVQRELPGLERPESLIIPVLPLEVAAVSTAGRGAGITPRLWFGAQLGLPINRRDGEKVILQVTLRDVIGWIWPNGWDKRRDLERLRQGLRDLSYMGVVYDRKEWLLVQPAELPTADTHLDQHIGMYVASLPDSGRGPMIDTVRLWQLGVRAGAPWRAWIRLAYLWDAAKMKNGRKRLYATRPAVKRGTKGVLLDLYDKPVMDRGKPVTDWSDARAVLTGKEERNPRTYLVPMLNTRDLAHLDFDHGEVEASTLRDRATETRRWLQEMERLGAVVLEWERDNVRVLEPRPKDETPGLLINPTPGADGVNSRR